MSVLASFPMNAPTSRQAFDRPIRVHVIADPLVAWGLERLVQSAHPLFEVAGVSERVLDCQTHLRQATADVVLLDLDSVANTDDVAELFARTQVCILAISGSRDASVQDRAVLAGVRGVMEKKEPPALLLKALEKVHQGELWVSRAATSRIFMELARANAAKQRNPEQDRIALLTPRERQSIAALTDDPTSPGKVIAARLNISEHTLRNHLTSIYGKLGVANRLALYAYARQHGLHQAA